MQFNPSPDDSLQVGDQLVRARQRRSAEGARRSGARSTANAPADGASAPPMTARRLDGAALAARIRAELVPRVAAFTARHGRPPGFAVVLAGSDPASEIYVRNKLKAVAEAGCRGELVRLGDRRVPGRRADGRASG